MLIRFIVLWGLFPWGLVAEEKFPILLAFVEGRVRVDGKPAQNGQLLQAKSMIETENGASCSLLMGRSTVVRIGPRSKLKVEDKLVQKGGKEEASVMELEHGRFRALVARDSQMKKSMKIKTRSAVMGVRGTDVYVEAPLSQAEPVTFLTIEGSAEVTIPKGDQPQVVTLTENQSVSPGEAAVELPPEEVKEMVVDLTGPGEPEEPMGVTENLVEEGFEELASDSQEQTEEVATEDTQEAIVNLTVDFQ